MAANNAKNLIPQNKRTKQEQREIARKGGIASGVVRKRNSDIKKLLQSMLKNNVKVDERFLELYETFGVEVDGKNNVAELLTASLLYKAVTGDVQAIKYALELAGQDPSLQMRQEEMKMRKAQLEKGEVTTEDIGAGIQTLIDVLKNAQPNRTLPEETE